MATTCFILVCFPSIPSGGGGLGQNVLVSFAALIWWGSISAGVSVAREGWIQRDFEVEGIRAYGKFRVPGGINSSDQLMRNAVPCPSRWTRALLLKHVSSPYWTGLEAEIAFWQCQNELKSNNNPRRRDCGLKKLKALISHILCFCPTLFDYGAEAKRGKCSRLFRFSEQRTDVLVRWAGNNGRRLAEEHWDLHWFWTPA